MEIERKWMVSGWPDQENVSIKLLCTEYQEQGYLHTDAPIVRIRLEAHVGKESDARTEDESVTKSVKKCATPEQTKYILCFKSAGFLAREEIEIEIGEDHFARLADQIGQPLIRKVRRIYSLPGDLELEVNLVDEGQPTEFMYAEVEFGSVEQARSWNPADCGLGGYLFDDVTEKPGQSMSAYWARTRKAAGDCS